MRMGLLLVIVSKKCGAVASQMLLLPEGQSSILSCPSVPCIRSNQHCQTGTLYCVSFMVGSAVRTLGPVGEYLLRIGCESFGPIGVFRSCISCVCCSPSGCIFVTICVDFGPVRMILLCICWPISVSVIAVGGVAFVHHLCFFRPRQSVVMFRVSSVDLSAPLVYRLLSFLYCSAPLWCILCVPCAHLFVSFGPPLAGMLSVTFMCLRFSASKQTQRLAFAIGLHVNDYASKQVA